MKKHDHITVESLSGVRRELTSNELKWLEGRPQIIRDLMGDFPPGTQFVKDGVIHWIVGYTEEGGVFMSPMNPSVDLSIADQAKIPLCPQCVELIRNHLKNNENTSIDHDPRRR